MFEPDALGMHLADLDAEALADTPVCTAAKRARTSSTILRSYAQDSQFSAIDAKKETT